MSHFYGTEYEILAGFGLVGWQWSLITSDWSIKSATFEGNLFFCVWDFLNIVESAIKSCVNEEVRKPYIFA